MSQAEHWKGPSYSISSSISPSSTTVSSFATRIKGQCHEMNTFFEGLKNVYFHGC
jgi:hypothetical protein